MRHRLVQYLVVIVTLLSVGSSCASRRHSAYESWAAKPTPSVFGLDAPWMFIELGDDGRIDRAVTLSFTDEPAADSCIGGDWRKLHIAQPQPSRVSNKHVVAWTYRGDGPEPAYLVEGSALWIVFTANICDVEDAFIGEITQHGFTGKAREGGLGGSSDLGPVYGAPIAWGEAAQNPE